MNFNKAQTNLTLMIFLLAITIIYSCKKDKNENWDSKFEIIDSESFYPEKDWIEDMKYEEPYIMPVLLRDNYVPQVEVTISGKPYWLLFDYGTSGDLWITSELQDKVDYVISGETSTLWPDGSYRATVYDISLSSVSIFNQDFTDLRTTLADWSIYSSKPFNGAVGLKYLLNHRVTLDYRQGILAFSQLPLHFKSADSLNYIFAPLIELEYHPYGIHVEGKINNADALIYFDSGTSHTFIDSKILNTENIIVSNGKEYYNGIVEIEIGGLSIQINNPRVEDITRGSDYKYPIRCVLGANALRYFVITTDRTYNNNCLMIHK